MTPEQKERIRAAARELSAALSEAGGDFYVDHHGIEVTTMGDGRRWHTHNIKIILRAQEVIA